MTYRRSRLLPIGLALLTVALVVPAWLGSLVSVLERGTDASAGGSFVVGLVKIAAGLSQVLFFLAGLSCALIGWRRNRRAGVATKKD